MTALASVAGDNAGAVNGLPHLDAIAAAAELGLDDADSADMCLP